MIQAVALRQRARQPVLGQRAAVEQHSLGHRAGAARGLDRLLYLRACDQAHVDDHVGEEARGGATARGPGDARAPALAAPGGGPVAIDLAGASDRCSAVAVLARDLRRSRRHRRRDHAGPCSPGALAAAVAGRSSMPKIACRSGPLVEARSSRRPSLCLGACALPRRSPQESRSGPAHDLERRRPAPSTTRS